MKKLLFLSAILSLLVYACGTDTFEETLVPDPPHNPYDDIDYNAGMVPKTPVDSKSFPGIHTYILAKGCNRPTCHDGTFEPDYRTVSPDTGVSLATSAGDSALFQPAPFVTGWPISKTGC